MYWPPDMKKMSIDPLVRDVPVGAHCELLAPGGVVLSACQPYAVLATKSLRVSDSLCEEM